VTPGRARLARAAAVAIVGLCLVSSAGSVVVGTVVHERISSGQIVVVGDLATPGMREVLAELEARAAEGDPLVATGGDWNVAAGVFMVGLLVWVGIGVFIVWRQPANWAGWLLLITGAPFALLSGTQALVVYGLKVEPGSVPLVGVLVVLGEFALYPLALIPLLFLLYPDGHPPGARWRWSVAGLVGGTALAFVAFLLRPGSLNNWRDDGIVYENPLGIEAFEFGGAVIAAGTVLALVSALSMVVAVRGRFRRSSGVERQQMRVLVFVATVAGTLIVLQFGLVPIFEAFGSEDSVPIFPILFGATAFTLVLGIPTAYVVAILRYRLWDLDVVIRKTVVAATLAVFIGIVYAAIVLVPGAILGTERNPGLAFAAAAVLAIAFQPARDRARRLADRLVYGKRATPYEVLTEFSDRVGDVDDVDDVLQHMAEIVGTAVGAERASIWLRVGSSLRRAAAWPAGSSPSIALPIARDALPQMGSEDAVEVRHGGELLGAISVATPRSEPLDPGKERLVRDLATQAGLVLRNVRLIEELRASRQRLVAAQDEERRKLERDLHDGAQQQLVALQVQLRLAEQFVGRDADRQRDLLRRLQSATGEALDDLRDLARGIYPPLLADRGLQAALEAQARRAPLPVVVEAEGVGRFERDVESAVYFCVLEALNNVAKYARAARAVVRLRETDGRLRFEVEDDGSGFDPDEAGYGTGLQGMADRLDAIGGELVVESAPGSGTRVAGFVSVREVVPA
jgi:signal transduction histidine kinase